MNINKIKKLIYTDTTNKVTTKNTKADILDAYQSNTKSLEEMKEQQLILGSIAAFLLITHLL